MREILAVGVCGVLVLLAGCTSSEMLHNSKSAWDVVTTAQEDSYQQKKDSVVIGESKEGQAKRTITNALTYDLSTYSKVTFEGLVLHYTEENHPGNGSVYMVEKEVDLTKVGQMDLESEVLGLGTAVRLQPREGTQLGLGSYSWKDEYGAQNSGFLGEVKFNVTSREAGKDFMNAVRTLLRIHGADKSK